MATEISGIKIPDSKIAQQAAELVRQHETEMLFNHSVRVFLFGAMKGIRNKLTFDPELLYVAALFHDLGLVDAYHTASKRFEIDGADAAREFLRSHGIPEPKADLVWEAIALHTTPGVPELMRPEIALTKAGVVMDVVGIGYDEYTPEQRDQVVATFPRGDFKREFIRDQTRSALRKPETTFGTINVEYIEYSDPGIPQAERVRAHPERSLAELVIEDWLRLMPKTHLAPFAAGGLAIGIFILDTLSPLQFAVAVLYVVVVLIAGSYSQRRGVLVAAAARGALTILSFLLEHGFDPEETAPLRCIVSSAAIGITTFLALKNLAAIERLRETERQRTNLTRFFSPRLVDQLVGVDTPLSIARYQPAAVMFVDMVGFTAHSAAMAPEAVIALLREFSALLSEAVFAHDGTIDKFLGDGVMAVFGPPLPSRCDASNAARCALDIKHAVDAWNERRHRLGHFPIRVAIGIHHGEVVQGDIGSDRRLELTVLGNMVNIASRIEAYCRALDAAVLVSDAFIDALHAEGGDQLAERFTDQGRHILRGHAELIQLYGVRRPAQALDRSCSRAYIVACQRS